MSFKHPSKLRENATVKNSVPIGDITMARGVIQSQCRGEQVGTSDPAKALVSFLGSVIFFLR